MKRQGLTRRANMKKVKYYIIAAMFLVVCAAAWIYVLNYAPPVKWNRW